MRDDVPVDTFMRCNRIAPDRYAEREEPLQPVLNYREGYLQDAQVFRPSGLQNHHHPATHDHDRDHDN